jgi:hypothetical protein
MGKADRTVEELVGMIKHNELRLPEMQRGYVWKAPRVRDLLDSLYRGYPSGAILVWETDGPVPLRQAAVAQDAASSSKSMLLLDGQQRLTSLASVLNGEPVTVRGKKRPIELLFNLEHPDALQFATEVDEEADDDEDLDDADTDDLTQRFRKMAFIVSTSKLANVATWVKVTDVFRNEDNTPFIERTGVANFKDPLFKKYNDRLNRLREVRKYLYRVDILDSKLSYDEVTEIFVRVNSLGAKLRSSDLAMAQITARWRSSLKVFEEFQTKCADKGFPLELGLHVRNLVAFATGQSRFKTVHTLDQTALADAWKQSKRGLEFAMSFCKSNAEIDSPALLSSPFFLIALSFAGHRMDYNLTPRQEADLRYWLLVANTKGRLSRGSSETMLDQDLGRLKKGSESLSALIDSVRTQFGRLDIVPGDLESRNTRSAYFKTMFLAFRQDGAKDWRSNLKISFAHVGRQHTLQFHHVFPRALLKGHYTSAQINDIANFAFLDGRTNRKISAKPPQEYLGKVLAEQGKKALESQCIPADLSLLRIDRYLEFLVERRRLITARLNRFLNDVKELHSA